jgi:hypothetical protein
VADGPFLASHNRDPPHDVLRVLTKVRTDPKWATALVRTLLVLTNREVTR